MFIRSFSVAAENTGVTSEVPLLTIRCKAIYQGSINRTNVQIDLFSASTEGTKPVRIRLVKNGTLGGTPAYSDIDTTNSVVEYDTAATAVTGGTSVIRLELAKTDGNATRLDQLNLFLQPGDTLTVAATSSASAEVRVSLNWREYFP